MSISKTRFVVLFLISSFVFQFISNSLIGSEVRLFPQHGDSFLQVESSTPWKSAVAVILLPVRIVLIGPLIPYIDFLRQDPDTPPPFFVIGFALYWAVLALAAHYFLSKLKRS